MIKIARRRRLPREFFCCKMVRKKAVLRKAVSALLRQVDGKCRNDRWTWADLAQCQRLLGDEADALKSYARVRALGDDDTVASVTAVLERLAKAAPVLKSRVTNAITQLNA